MLPERVSEVDALTQQARYNVIQTVNSELINLYWLVGPPITQHLANASRGEKTIDELALSLKTYHPERKGFNRRGLYRMKQFYETYSASQVVLSLMTQLKSKDIKSTVLAQVSWTITSFY